MKKSADIGRIASKHVKVTVSGKNSYSTGKDRAVTLSLKKSKIQSQIASVENMNHVNDKENENNDVEEMDTQEGKSGGNIVLFGVRVISHGGDRSLMIGSLIFFTSVNSSTFTF